MGRTHMVSLICVVDARGFRRLRFVFTTPYSEIKRIFEGKALANHILLHGLIIW